MNTNHIIPALALELPGEGQDSQSEIFLCLPSLLEKRPSGRPGNPFQAHIFLVIDCSTNSSGQSSFIHCYNELAQALYNLPSVTDLEILIYGNSVDNHITYSKPKIRKIKEILIRPEKDQLKNGIDILQKTLEKTIVGQKDDKKKYFAIFFGDKATQKDKKHPISNLSEKLAELKATLAKLPCEMLFATANAEYDIDTMMAFDEVSKKESEIILGSVFKTYSWFDSIVKRIKIRPDDIAIKFEAKDNIGFAQKFEEKFNWNASENLFKLSTTRNFLDSEISAEIEQKTYKIDIIKLEDSIDFKGVGELVFSLIRAKLKNIVLKLLKSKINKEVAMKEINSAISYFSETTSALKFVDAIKQKFASKESFLSKAGRESIRLLKEHYFSSTLMMGKALSKIKYWIQKESYEDAFNICMKIFTPDPEIAHNKYSKRNQKRRRHINYGHPLKQIGDSEALFYLESESLPMRECSFWISNPLALDPAVVKKFKTKGKHLGLYVNDWVGFGVQVSRGKFTLPSPWNIQEVVLTPLIISQNACKIFELEKDKFKGENEKFKFAGRVDMSIPLLDSEYHFGEVRLILQNFRRNFNCQAQLKDIFVEKNNEFHPQMIDALYVSSVLSSFKKAGNDTDFDLVFKALLTIIDNIHFQSNFEANSKASWVNILNILLNKKKEGLVVEEIQGVPKAKESEMKKSESRDEHDSEIEEDEQPKKKQVTSRKKVKEAKENQKVKYNANKFIATNNDFCLPDVSRAFIPLTCIQEAYEAPIEEINKIFFKLLIKVLSDESSKYSLEKLIGQDHKKYSTLATELFENAQGKYAQIPSIGLGQNHQQVSISISKLVSMYAIHTGIRKHLQASNQAFDAFYEKLIKRETDWKQGALILTECFYEAKIDLEHFVAVLTAPLTR